MNELHFIENENLGLQLAISDSVLDQLIGTIVTTNFTNILPLDTLFDEMDFHITTDMLAPVLP